MISYILRKHAAPWALAALALSVPALAQAPEPTLSRERLARWVVAASERASGGARRLSQPVADAMAGAALRNPFGTDDAALVGLASLEVSIAWFETGGQLALSPRGSNDGGASACWAQVYLPHGARTLEGWSAAELRADPDKCATVAVRLIHQSFERGPSDCGLCLYARGRDTPEARRLSGARVALAERLAREVPLPP